MKHFPILVEGPTDRVLLKSFGLSKKEIVKANGKPKIGTTLEKKSNQYSFVIADENTDQNSHPFFSRFKTIRYFENYGIIIQKYSKIHLILFSNQLEKWIINTSSDCGINLKKIGLPAEIDKLHDFISQEDPPPNEYLILIDEMQKKKCKSYIFLKNLVLNRNNLSSYLKSL